MEEQEKNEKWITEVMRLVEHYQMMEAAVPESSMLREVQYQYTDMAAGGDGGDLGFEKNGQTTCRGVNYPGYPDWVFLEVVKAMAWEQEV